MEGETMEMMDEDVEMANTQTQIVVSEEEELYLKKLSEVPEDQIANVYKKINLDIRPSTDLSPLEVMKMLRRNEVLYSKVKKVEEAACDAKLIKNLSYICKKNLDAVTANAMTFKYKDFAEKLCVKLKKSSDDKDSLMTKQMLVRWGGQIKILWRKSPCLTSLNGSLRMIAPERKERNTQRTQRARTRDADLVATQATIVESTDSGGTATEKRVVKILQTLVEAYKQNNKSAVSYFNFVVDPTCFGATVENIFHVSFLIKESKAEIFVTDNVPYIKPVKGKQSTGEAIQRKQVVTSINMYEWRRLIDVLGISEPMIPPIST